MNGLDQLTRYERWTCEQALRAEEGGPWKARALPAFEFGMALLVAVLSIRSVASADTISAVCAMAGGVFLGRAVPDLLYPRTQRLLAVLYRACLGRDADRTSP